MIIPSLHTPRLLLQPLQLADAEQIQPLFGQWEVVRYLNAQVPWPYPADGALGYFQHRFRVYDREGRPCSNEGCSGTVHRKVQGGRSTFYCPVCQR